MALRINVEPLTALAQRLRNFADRVEDTAELRNRVGEYLVNNIKERILNGRDIDGNSFIPSNRAKFTGGNTLNDTGMLLGSIQYWLSGNTLDWGSDWIYAHVLNAGAVINGPMSFYDYVSPGTTQFFKNVQKVTIPARTFMDNPTDEESVQIGQMMMDYYQEVWDASS
jgi:phage gpG-like protein